MVTVCGQGLCWAIAGQLPLSLSSGPRPAEPLRSRPWWVWDTGSSQLPCWFPSALLTFCPAWGQSPEPPASGLRLAQTLSHSASPLLRRQLVPALTSSGDATQSLTRAGSLRVHPAPTFCLLLTSERSL